MAITSTTTKITLRPIRLSDIDDFMACVGDDRVTRYTIMEAYTSKEEALKYLKETAIPHPWLRAICLEEDRLVGYIFVRPEQPGPFQYKAELGYALSFKYWGQGIVTEAVKMVVSSVFKEIPNLVRLEAKTDAGNKASQRVLEKSGFTKEGLLRKYYFYKGNLVDLCVYSFLSTDPILE